MSKESLFVRHYNNSNNIHVKEKLDIHDECSFSYLDILKNKEVEVVSKGVKECKCVSSVNFSAYYDKCDKCSGKGTLTLNGNDVICNRCYGKKRTIKNKCPLCHGEGKVIDEMSVKVQLSDSLKEGDVVTLIGKGEESNGVKGDLIIKVHIYDYDNFEIKGNDVYDKRIIQFKKDDISKGVSKSVETIKGYVKVSSSGQEELEVVKLEGEGLNEGNFYICLKNELTPVKGKDVYKNIIINKEKLSFYIDRNELYSDIKCLTTHYYKKVNEENYEFIKLDDVNNFKVIKLKKCGLDGKYGGDKGDLYLRVFFDDEFINNNDELYHLPIKLDKFDVKNGKKTIEFEKVKVNLNYTKNLNCEEIVEIDELGYMINNKEFGVCKFIVSPFEYNTYKVSVRVSKKDKVIYVKNYKKYFFEEVSARKQGLMVSVTKSENTEVTDEEGNKIIVKFIK